MTDVSVGLAPALSPSAIGEVRRIARWTIAGEPDSVAATRLGSELLLPPEICRLLVIRGHATPDAAKAFLRPRLDALRDASSMLGMKAAVDRIAAAITSNEMILIHGDYDVDGICSTTLLTTVLRDLGARVTPFIPRRIEDGYDLGNAGVQAAVDAGAKVVITCDCGTSAFAAISKLCELGIDAIVTDHHLPSGEDVPICVAVLNPRQSGCEYPDKDLAGVGVAFKLAQQLVARMGGQQEKLNEMLDLVALATVADVAPLRGENRVLVRTGLRMMRETKRPGLRALIRSSGLVDKPITAGRIGFILAPRLNAVGRLDRAIRGVELLLSQSEHEANAIARDLEELNRKRQDIDRATLEEARKMLTHHSAADTCGIVLASMEWHPGVVGIVASRLVEETGRPTVLIAIADGVGKGSGRSIPAFNLHSGLSECADLLVRFGGHRAAAGVTIQPDAIEAFAARFNEVVRSRVAPEDFLPELRIDLEVSLADSDVDALEKLLRHFEPFGPANPGPVFLARAVTVTRPPRKVGENGLRFNVRAGQTDFEMLGWDLMSRKAELAPGDVIDVVFRIERDEWNGADRLQGRVLDFRRPLPLIDR